MALQALGPDLAPAVFLEEPVRLRDPRDSLRAVGRPPGLAARPLIVDPVERINQIGKVDVAVGAAKALLGHQHSRSDP